MTVTREQIQLFVERAPVDPFNDDGPAQFRVVAAVGQGAARRHVVPLTRAHDSAEDAMRVFADKVRNACTDTYAQRLVAEHAEDPDAHTHVVLNVPGDVSPVEAERVARRWRNRNAS